MTLNGSLVPRSTQDRADRELAFRFAPYIFFADEEPFLPLLVGYTIFREEAQSLSFPKRRIERQHLPAWESVIEYAVWMDWDIGHLYELEHTWSYVGPNGDLVFSEGSWHGGWSPMTLDDDTMPCEGPHPIVYAQPGKHAFAPSPDWFVEIKENVIEATTLKAGEDGVLVQAMYGGRIQKTPRDDELAAAYCRRRIFTPSMKFTQRVDISREMLVPWETMFEWIPLRVNWWMEQLRSGAVS